MDIYTIWADREGGYKYLWLSGQMNIKKHFAGFEILGPV